MANNWTVDKIGNLEGKIILVTGGNSGLGFEAVQIYAEHKAKVIMAVRTVSNGEKAKALIINKHPGVDIDIMELDLSSLTSIDCFVKEFISRYNHLDILLNNAGIMWVEYGKTIDGFEQQVGINHLGHFALTAKLFSLLKTTDDSRVVNISSVGHRAGDMDFSDFMFEGGNGYTPMRAYGRSKLANLLFTYELQRRVDEVGLSMKILAAHPGGSRTNLARYVSNKIWFKLLYPVLILMMQSAYHGSLPGVRASLDNKAIGGTYYGPSGFQEQKGKPVIVESNEASHNLKDAKKLWEISEKLTGVQFDV